jgi:hypothetical protein
MIKENQLYRLIFLHWLQICATYGFVYRMDQKDGFFYFCVFLASLLCLAIIVLSFIGE